MVVRPVRFRFDDFVLAPRQRVLLRNGFVEEGVLRSAVRKRGRLHDLRVFARLSSSSSSSSPGQG